jgi:hypothetical protein
MEVYIKVFDKECQRSDDGWNHWKNYRERRWNVIDVFLIEMRMGKDQVIIEGICW